jgi:SulP family sulfate permease
MPCGGSFSRSSVNRVAGARSRWSGAFTGLAVLAFLPFAAVLEPLPLAVLGAIVITAVTGLMRFGPLVKIWRLSRPQAIIAWTTFGATLLLAPRIDLAVLVGIGLSIAVFLWRSMQLEIDVAARDRTLTVVPRGVLWFATAQKLDVVVHDAIAGHPEVARLVVDLGGLGRIDTTGALVLRSLLDRVRTAGVSAEVCRVPRQSRALTERILGPEDPLRGGLS